MYFTVDTLPINARPAVLWLRDRGAFNIDRWPNCVHDQALCYQRFEHILYEIGAGHHTVGRFILRNKTLATEFKLTWGM